MEITWELILAVAGGIVVISNAFKALANIINPVKKISEKVKRHDEILDVDNKRLTEIENSMKIICKSMLVLLEHEITGNSIEKLKSAKKELQDFLIER